VAAQDFTAINAATASGEFEITAATWSPPNAIFNGNIAYSVELTLTAKSGYTFAGLAAGTSAFTVTNATSVANTATADGGATITVTVTFPATEPNPAIDGTISIAITDATTGRLQADITGNSYPSNPVTWSWSVAGQGTTLNGTQSARVYTPAASELGKEITATVTQARVNGTLTANTTVYRVDLSLSGATGTDAATINGGNAYGLVGSNITINYTLDNSDVYNALAYSGVATPPTQVTTPGTATSTYPIAAADAANGIITITATFAHSNLLMQTLTFALGDQTRNFGDAPFTITPTGGQGTGAITYTSSNHSVAMVDNSGTVTITGAGTTTITATIAADATYASATASYVLTVNNASQAAPTGLGRTNETAAGANDGTITGVTTAMEYRLSTDTAYTPVTETTITGLAPGTYFVRFAAALNYDAGADATITIAAFQSLSGVNAIPTLNPMALVLLVLMLGVAAFRRRRV
jgi:hypothetical protein